MYGLSTSDIGDGVASTPLLIGWLDCVAAESNDSMLPNCCASDLSADCLIAEPETLACFWKSWIPASAGMTGATFAASAERFFAYAELVKIFSSDTAMFF